MRVEAQRLLRDIHGLDAASWWPPAPGWWVLLAVSLVLVLALALLLGRWRARRRAWRNQVRGRLRLLHRELGQRSPKETAGDLSELLRIVAVARFDRRRCAGLTGAAWLEWLTRHDPAGFDWSRRGKPLLQLPYAPDGERAGRAALGELIEAALHWVEAVGPADAVPMTAAGVGPPRPGEGHV